MVRILSAFDTDNIKDILDDMGKDAIEIQRDLREHNLSSFS